MMKIATPFVALMASLSSPALGVENGDVFCLEGFVMDRFCIDRGTLLDRPSVVTLEDPGRHTVHCLVDVRSCLRTEFEILLDPEITGLQNFLNAFRLDEATKDLALEEARRVGSCSTCTGSGGLSEGYRAALIATVTDASVTPPIVTATNLASSNGVMDPCATLFPGENVPTVVEIWELEKQQNSGGEGTDDDPFSNFLDEGATDGRTPLQRSHLIHGSLMLIGWGFLLPTGTLFAKFFKHRPDGLWFKIHRTCQTVGLVIALAGWIVALKNFQVFADVGYNNYRHGILGMVTMLLGLLQPINAVVRPHPPADGEEPTTLRRIWEITHKSLGWIAILSAVVTIGLGTVVLPFPDDQKAFQYAYGLGEGGVLLLLMLAMQMDKRSYVASGKTGSKGPEKAVSQEDDA